MCGTARSIRLHLFDVDDIKLFGCNPPVCWEASRNSLEEINDIGRDLSMFDDKPAPFDGTIALNCDSEGDAVALMDHTNHTESLPGGVLKIGKPDDTRNATGEYRVLAWL